MEVRSTYGYSRVFCDAEYTDEIEETWSSIVRLDYV
jgi:hypothetical protein